MTRLEAFRIANGVKSTHLAEESGVSRAYLARLRFGKIDPTRAKMLAIRDGYSRLLGRQVHLAEIFDLGEPAVIVTRRQGDRFAEEWYRGDILDACDATGIMRWPDEDSHHMTEAQDRFHNIMDEICEGVFDAVRQAISEAFVRVAAEVLARERSRG